MSERFIDYLPLPDVKLAARNPKEHDGPGIKRSLDHFGMAELPLIDERTGRLVAGHGRYEQLVRLAADGRKVPEGVKVAEDGTWLMPVVRGWASRSDDDAEAYLVASNKLSEKGGWDDRGLAEVLHDLADAQFLDLSAFDAAELDNLDALLDDGAWDPPAAPRRLNAPSADEDDDLDEGWDDEDEGDGVADRDMWPKIDVQVAPHIFDAWRTFLDQHDGKNDAVKVEAALRALGHLA